MTTDRWPSPPPRLASRTPRTNRRTTSRAHKTCIACKCLFFFSVNRGRRLGGKSEAVDNGKKKSRSCVCLDTFCAARAICTVCRSPASRLDHLWKIAKVAGREKTRRTMTASGILEKKKTAYCPSRRIHSTPFFFSISSAAYSFFFPDQTAVRVFFLSFKPGSMALEWKRRKKGRERIEGIGREKRLSTGERQSEERACGAQHSFPGKKKKENNVASFQHICFFSVRRRFPFFFSSRPVASKKGKREEICVSYTPCRWSGVFQKTRVVG